ncbi:MAG: C40 family peptidase [Gemmatimonadaceae bacterium]
MSDKVMLVDQATLLVDAAVTPLQAEPRAGSEQVSQTLAGHRLTCIERRDPWLRVRAWDGYEGWLHQGYLASGSTSTARDSDAVGRISLGCAVRERTGRVRALPLGAVLDGDAAVVRGDVVPSGTRAERFPCDGAAIAQSAMGLFQGTPYQWGGITPWGADCSGMVQTVFRLHGIPLPRDARQQAEHGAPGPDTIELLEAGDLLFFSDRADGCITHVGIALGALRMVHLALGRGGYRIELLTDGDDAYVTALRDRLRLTRRMVPAEQARG